MLSSGGEGEEPSRENILEYQLCQPYFFYLSLCSDHISELDLNIYPALWRYMGSLYENYPLFYFQHSYDSQESWGIWIDFSCSCCAATMSTTAVLVYYGASFTAWWALLVSVIVFVTLPESIGKIVSHGHSSSVATTFFFPNGPNRAISS